ncbi:MAG: hypothetical protein NZ534_00060 [Bacteroidia bacterium]|nr:hypothetical protein [Bacteroidia bacterium]
MSILAFSGTGNVVIISATSSSSTEAALPGTAFGGQAARVYNAAAGVAHVRFGSASGTTATTSDTFVAPGATEVFNIPPDITHVAAILSSGTGNVYVQRGAGL